MGEKKKGVHVWESLRKLTAGVSENGSIFPYKEDFKLHNYRVREISI